MKPYNPIKAEEKIMNEPLTKDEYNFIESFSLDKQEELNEELDSEVVDSTYKVIGYYDDVYPMQLNEFETLDEAIDLQKKSYDLFNIVKVFHHGKEVK